MKIQIGGNIKMVQSQNLSTPNALVRLTMGLSMLAYGTSCLVKNPSSNKGRMLVLLGAMKAAEGTVKYCPTKALMNTTPIQNMMSGTATQSTTGGSSQSATSGSASQSTTSGSRMQNMMSGTVLQNMMGGSGLQNAVPEVGQLMKDFASIVSGNTTNNNNASGNANNNSSSNNNQSGSGIGNSIADLATSGIANAASGNANKNNTGNMNNNASTNGTKNGSSAINPS